MSESNIKYIVIYTHQFFFDEKHLDLVDFFDDGIKIEDLNPCKEFLSNSDVALDDYTTYAAINVKFIGMIPEEEFLKLLEEKYFDFESETMGSITPYGWLPADSYRAEHYDPYKNNREEILNLDQNYNIYVTPVEDNGDKIEVFYNGFKRLREIVENEYKITEKEVIVC